jgi:hypothetical protein
VDAYDTIVNCDFSVLRQEVPALAGIPAGLWDTEYDRLGPLLTDGRMSKTEAFGQILRASGQPASATSARTGPNCQRWPGSRRTRWTPSSSGSSRR